MSERLELALLGLVKKLEDGLPAAVTAINTGTLVQADGIGCEVPVEVLDHVPPLEVQERWPLVGVQQLPSTFPNDTGTEMEGSHRVLVVAFLQHDDRQVLARQCRRLLAAIRTVVMADRTIPHPFDTVADIVAYGVLADQTVPGPMLADIPNDGEPPDGYITWSGFQVRFTTDELD